MSQEDGIHLLRELDDASVLSVVGIKSFQLSTPCLQLTARQSVVA